MFFFQKSIKKNYDLKETIGTGSFAEVKLGIHKKTGQKYAVKVIDKTNVGDMAENLQTEIEILKTVDHPSIIALHEIFDYKHKLYLVMELVTGGELFDRIVDRGSYSEKDASQLIRRILDAVDYLHKKGIVHRDLKPENLLFADATDAIKIADFGLAKIASAEKQQLMQTTCGTPGYVAPEVLKNEGYDKAVDLWSIGVILYILLCGFPPFYEESTPLLFDLIMKGQYDFPDPYWTNISDSAKDLVRKLLVVDPKKRYTAEQTLTHPWITGETASDAQLETAANMKKFAARKKFKQAALGIMATQRMALLLGKKAPAKPAAEDSSSDDEDAGGAAGGK